MQEDMLTVISPAKSLNYDSDLKLKEFSIPHFSKETWDLSQKMKKFSNADIKKLMKISDKLADLNHDRFQNFAKDYNEKNSKQALLVFNGDVYGSIKKEEYNEKNFAFAQDNLRILSGLYGLLRPLDLMQAYRLEMGTDFKKNNLEFKNLYEFWGDKISTHINELEDKYLINLASNEYFDAINPKTLKAKIINIVFKEQKADTYKIIGIHAKKARGMMVDFIIKNKITDPKKLKDFDYAGYKLHSEFCDDDSFVFTR